jgi:hypothetical protein
MSDNPSDGISALDVGDLPEPQRSIMLVLIRDAGLDGLTLDDLHATLENVPGIDAALHDLRQRGQVIVIGSGRTERYRPAIKRKRGRTGLDWGKLLDDKDNP